MPADSAIRTQREVQVIVVGAGLAGLVTARALTRLGISTLVLEARDRVGGKTLNHALGPDPDAVVELGGQWVGPSQKHVLALAEALGLELFDTFDDGARLLEYEGKLRRYRGDFLPANLWSLFSITRGLFALERMAKTVIPDAPWRGAKAATWDAQTFEAWLEHNVRNKFARTFLRCMCESVFAAEASQVSLLHVLAFARASGSFEQVLRVRGGAQHSRIRGGSQLLSLALAAELGDCVELSSPVRTIRWSEQRVEVHSDRFLARAERVVVAMSPALTGRIEFDPAVPPDRAQLLERSPNGSVIKCLATYSTPFWREAGLSGQALSDVGPVKFTYDNTPWSGTPGVLVGFIEGDHAREFAGFAPAERRAAVLAGFARFFGPAAAAPLDYVDKAWSEDEWTLGCYGVVLPPNTWTELGAVMRRPLGPIVWAGAEISPVSMNYMDGAVASGEDAAREVAASLAASTREVNHLRRAT